MEIVKLDSSNIKYFEGWMIREKQMLKDPKFLPCYMELKNNQKFYPSKDDLMKQITNNDYFTFRSAKDDCLSQLFCPQELSLANECVKKHGEKMCANEILKLFSCYNTISILNEAAEVKKKFFLLLLLH